MLLIDSLNRFYDYMAQDELKLPNSTTSLEDDLKVHFLHSYRDGFLIKTFSIKNNLFCTKGSFTYYYVMPIGFCFELVCFALHYLLDRYI